MNLKIRLALSLAVLATPRIIHAEPARKVEIVLDLGTCPDKLPKTLFVVVDGKEEFMLDAHRDETGNWSRELNGTIRPEKAFASLRRMNGTNGRSGCTPSKPKDDPDDPEHIRKIASFEFHCNKLPVKDVDFLPNPDSVSVRYVRRHVLENHPCTEYGLVGAAPVRDVWSGEELSVVLIPEKKNVTDIPGLIVFTPDWKKGNALTLSEHLKRHLSPCKAGYCVDRNGAVLTLTEQRADGHASPPTLSSVAIDIDFAKLSKAGLLQLATQVK